MIEFFPTELKLKSLDALLPFFFPLPPWNMNGKIQSCGHVIIVTYRATRGGQGSRTLGEPCDTGDFTEPLCRQLPLQQPHPSSLVREWFAFFMPTSSLLIDFSNHCTKIALEKITPNFIVSFQLT